MRGAIRTIVKDYPGIHLTLGLIGNTAFFIGSVLFLPQLEPWKTTGVWLFIIGAGLMLLGALGRALVELLERH